MKRTVSSSNKCNRHLVLSTWRLLNTSDDLNLSYQNNGLEQSLLIPFSDEKPLTRFLLSPLTGDRAGIYPVFLAPSELGLNRRPTLTARGTNVPSPRRSHGLFPARLQAAPGTRSLHSPARGERLLRTGAQPHLRPGGRGPETSSRLPPAENPSGSTDQRWGKGPRDSRSRPRHQRTPPAWPRSLTPGAHPSLSQQIRTSQTPC